MQLRKFLTRPGGISWFLRGAIALLLLSGGRPAIAGHYGFDVDSGSGTLSSTVGGVTTNQSLTENDAAPSWGFPYGQMGSLSYTYTETFYYQWEPDEGETIDDDPPVNETVTLTGSATLQFFGTSSVVYNDANAQASATMGGNTALAKYRTHNSNPGNVGTLMLLEDSSGSYSISKNVVLSGESGTFSITYTGSMNTGGEVLGEFELQKAIPRGFGQYIRFTAPAKDQTFHVGYGNNSTTVSFAGKWTRPRNYNGRNFKVQVLAWYNAMQLGGTQVGACTGTFNAASGTWPSVPQICQGTIHVNQIQIALVAQLMVYDANVSDYVLPADDGRWIDNRAIYVEQ